MGEMTIRLDEALLLELESRARVLGKDPARFVTELLQQALGTPNNLGRTAVARELLAAQDARRDLDGALLIREDRDRR